MAKLKTKPNTPKVEESPAPAVPAEEVQVEDQSTALEGAMSAITAHAAEAEEETPAPVIPDEDGEVVEEHSEEEPIGDNPDTAPPPAPVKKEDEVVMARPKQTKAAVATTVKVCTVCDHSCHIGGTAYHFKKGVPTTVPEPVKKILREAGLLAAL